MPLFDRDGLEDARRTVRRHLPPTPQYAWPLLADAVGSEVWVKHENHTPTGAFKVRGGLVLAETLRRRGFAGRLVTATRGNHGQSLALAARMHGLGITIVVPEGNDDDQVAAMRGFGADVVVSGRDFQAALEHAESLVSGGEGEGAEGEGAEGTDAGTPQPGEEAVLVPPFAPDLVRGVATYAQEFLEEAGDLHRVYVPVGMGSGICALITVRDLMGLRTEIVGVVAAGAPAYALSFAAGEVVQTEEAATFADGVATRSPSPLALEVILAGAADVIRVDEEEIADALRLLYRTTHNVAEGAGAVALAGLLSQTRSGVVPPGSRVGIVLSGGNIAMARLAALLDVGPARDRGPAQVRG